MPYRQKQLEDAVRELTDEQLAELVFKHLNRRLEKDIGVRFPEKQPYKRYDYFIKHIINRVYKSMLSVAKKRIATLSDSFIGEDENLKHRLDTVPLEKKLIFQGLIENLCNEIDHNINGIPTTFRGKVDKDGKPQELPRTKHRAEARQLVLKRYEFVSEQVGRKLYNSPANYLRENYLCLRCGMDIPDDRRLSSFYHSDKCQKDQENFVGKIVREIKAGHLTRSEQKNWVTEQVLNNFAQ